jgi:hypothetical protein
MQERVGRRNGTRVDRAWRSIVAVGILAATAVPPSAALAQQGFEDAPFVFIDVRSGLRYEDNLVGDDELSFDTALSAGFFAATSNRRLSLEGGVLLRALEGEHSITDPFLTASYAIFSRESELSFDLEYRATDLDDRVINDEFDAGDLIQDGGRRERLEARIGLVTGRFAPFGTDTRLRYRQTTFSADAGEDDERFHSLANTVFLRFNPQVTVRGTSFLSHTVTDNALDTEETVTRFGIGTDLAIDRAWSASFDLNFTTLETEINGAVPGSRISTVTDGVGASAVLTRDVRNGVYTFSASRVIADTGFQDTFRVRRTLMLANGADIDASIGVASFEGADPILIYNLSYANEILRGVRFNAALDRSGGVSDDDENIIRTRFNAGLGRDLTRRSSVSVDTTLLQVEERGPTGTDTARVNLGLVYRHALTEDWNFAARLSRQITFEDGDREDRVDAVSLTLERRFSFRP